MPGKIQRSLLIDISNSYTKFALADFRKVGRIHRIPTSDVTPVQLPGIVAPLDYDRIVLASVVPRKSAIVKRVLKGPLLEVSVDIDLGVGIRYPHPRSIGADRLANAAAAVALCPLPAVVVDFGTAVTFDVLSGDGFYIGGVIAPGLAALTDYLHEQTALLPAIDLVKPRRAVGKSTREAMLAGAIHGYRGLIREILYQIAAEEFAGKIPHVVATGGDALRIAKLLPIFDSVLPGLTLEGLRRISFKNPPDFSEKTGQTRGIPPKRKFVASSTSQ